MPRKGKRKKAKPAGEPQLSTHFRERGRLISTFWTGVIRAALREKAEYIESAKTTEQYLRPDHSSLFEDEGIRSGFMNFAGSAAISVPKVAQMVNVLGPRLYLSNPSVKVHARTDDGVMAGLARVLDCYLRYTAKETKQAKHIRKTLNDAMVRGRGFLLHGIDQIRGVVTSRYTSSLDVVFDPDYTEIEDARWIAIRHREPLWETKRRITEKWRLKGLEKRVAVQDDQTHQKVESTDDPDAFTPSFSNEILTYWTVLSKMGKGFRSMKGKRRFNDDQDYCRLEIVLDHEFPLAEGDWEIPFYLDRDWPITAVDLVEAVDRHWPDSIAGQVTPLQRGVDLLTSLKLTSCKNRERLITMADSRLGKVNLNQFRNGSSADFITVDVPNGMTLEQAVKVMDFGQGNPETSVERDWLNSQIETTTGVTDVLHGGDEGQAKERSATATAAKQDAAGARVNDLIARVREFREDAARKEVIIAKLVLSAEEIKPYVRTSEIGLYYVRVDIPGAGTVPVRQIDRGNPEAALSLEELSPQASTYFQSTEEALVAAMRLWQEMEMSEDPRVAELTNTLLMEGKDPANGGLPLGIGIDVVTVERVWYDTAGLTAEEIMREIGYELAAGSTIRHNSEAIRANADNLSQTVLPVALQLGDYQAANKVLKIRDDAYEVPEDQRVYLTPPPMPEQQQQGSSGGEKEGK